jgi:hypothetical protein
MRTLNLDLERKGANGISTGWRAETSGLFI